MGKPTATIAAAAIIVTLAVLAGVSANDPDMLQDVCVADLNSTIKVNGFPCKTQFNSSDFFSDILAKPGNTNNTQGSLVTGANVLRIPGLNTLGVSLSRIDYAPGGLNPPHTHPRATEIAFVLYGELEVGFITTANVLVSKIIRPGEIFVFPRGLVHFQKNNGRGPASVIVAFDSQLPGTQSIAATLFGATPPLPDNVLSTAFQIGRKDVKKIKAKFAPKK
ncbi:germin-like protein subfamily 2 member 1 [Wolffia australiana]